MVESSPTLDELRKISKVLMLAHGPIIEGELLKIATSDARKKMWVLMDGKRTTKDLAREAKVTEQAAYHFQNALAAAGFIENPRGESPRRVLDYVPPSWIELIEPPSEVPQEPSGSKTATGRSEERSHV